MAIVNSSRSSTCSGRSGRDGCHDRRLGKIERLTGLGTRPVNETELPAVRWTTFADLADNEFDLVSRHPV
jgi:hypothetical protein